MITELYCGVKNNFHLGAKINDTEWSSDVICSIVVLW